MTTPRSSALRAEPELLAGLAEIDGAGAALRAEHSTEHSAAEHSVTGNNAEAPFSQQRADLMLAHIAWSRLAEPGDGAAGSMLAAFGAERALQLLVQGSGSKDIVAAANEAGVELSQKTVTEARERWLPRLNRAETVADIERARSSRLKVLLPGDDSWPAALDDLGLHAPIMLWTRGQIGRLLAPALGVVGARAATGYGTNVTAEIVDGVCAAGLVIVSGAAYGIDAVAHRTALAAGTPTIAVVAGGVDRPYPRAHDALLDRISESGLVCAEMIPGSAPTKWRFLMRNRVIAALSRAVLVTEAGLRSGSLNTAGHASELGRALGAVPGPVTSAASAGCHRLIREYNAMLVTNVQDALELTGVTDQLTTFNDTEMAGGRRDPSDADPNDRDSAWQRRALDALPLRGSRFVEDIARRAGLTGAQIAGVLAELELLGRVRRHVQPDGQSKWGLLR